MKAAAASGHEANGRKVGDDDAHYTRDPLSGANCSQPFRLLGDITAGIVDDLGHRRAQLLVEERPDG